MWLCLHDWLSYDLLLFPFIIPPKFLASTNVRTLNMWTKRGPVINPKGTLTLVEIDKIVARRDVGDFTQQLKRRLILDTFVAKWKLVTL